MKPFLTGTLVTICLLLSLPATLRAGDGEVDPFEFDAEAVMKRVEKMENEAVAPRYNTIVQGYIKTYVLRARAKAETILGHSVVYFPLFEDYLAKSNMPLDLRYLPVVESALDPRAVSRAGAAGLWQFMPETGREMGLQIDPFVDERRDPHKSTRAAMAYLRRLYDRYERWELALAAYNSGPGRVNRAIKRGRSKNFWRIRRYLPRETRNYVPAFIAATYLLKHYDQHQLRPAYPELDKQITEATVVYDSYSFFEIAQVTGLSIGLIEDLNPAFQRGFIPADPRGHFLVLPRRVAPAFREYADLRRRHPHLRQSFAQLNGDAGQKDKSYRDEDNYRYRLYKVRAKDTLPAIAERFRCTTHQLRAWNQLKDDRLEPGQMLRIYEERSVTRFMRREDLSPVAPLEPSGRRPLLLQSPEIDPLGSMAKIYYHVPKKARFSEIARALPHLSLAQLLLMNPQWSGKEKIPAGARICIGTL